MGLSRSQVAADTGDRVFDHASARNVARAFERLVAIEQPELAARRERALRDAQRRGERTAAGGEAIQHDDIERRAGGLRVAIGDRVAVRREQHAAGEAFAFGVRARRLSAAP
jgi:hypothetical protein